MIRDNETTIADALRALRARGVNTAEEVLELASPEQILTACRRWDTETDVSPGLLVHWIRNGQFETPPAAGTTAKSKGAVLRERFAEYAARFPEGSTVETHHALLERRWPDDVARAVENGHPICDGSMVVTSATYPVLAMECDACGFEAGVTPRQLHVLPAATRPEEDLGF